MTPPKIQFEIEDQDTMAETSSLNLTFPGWTAALLEEIAGQRHISVSDLIRQMLDYFMDYTPVTTKELAKSGRRIVCSTDMRKKAVQTFSDGPTGKPGSKFSANASSAVLYVLYQYIANKEV